MPKKEMLSPESGTEAPVPAPAPGLVLDVEKLPRVSSTTSFSRLKEEAKARELPASASHQVLLEALREGSICLSATPQHRFVRAILVKRKGATSNASYEAPKVPALLDLHAEALLRVCFTTSFSMIKEEVAVRGLKLRANASENELRVALGEGSICVSATPQYRYVQAVLSLIRKEELAKRAEEHASLLAKQAALHTLKAPGVHPCKLAPTAQLEEAAGGTRKRRTECSVCMGTKLNLAREAILCEWTCVRHDFNICGQCFKDEPERSIQRANAAAAETRKRKKREDASKEEARIYEQVRTPKYMERENKLDKFAPHVRQLQEGNKQRSIEGYTVWKSCGFPHYDGFHTYNGPPIQNFDSCFASAEDANARAKYIFAKQQRWSQCTESVNAEVDHDP